MNVVLIHITLDGLIVFDHIVMSEILLHFYKHLSSTLYSFIVLYLFTSTFISRIFCEAIGIIIIPNNNYSEISI